MRWQRGAVAYCVGADARTAWPSWLAVGLLLGLAAGATMAAAAAGNRTDTAYRDLRAETNAMDGAVRFRCAPSEADCPRTLEHVRALPGIRDAARFALTKAPVLDIDGQLIQANEDTCYSGTGEVSLITPIDPEFGTRLHRLRILEGRAADPGRVDEVVVAPLAAAEHGIDVGDRLFPRLVDCLEDRERWGAPIPVTVVGIGMTAAEIPPKYGFYLQGIHTTPAFADLLPASERPVTAVQLDPGWTFDEVAAGGEVPPVDVAFDEAFIGDPVDRGLRNDANAMWLVAGLSGVVAVFALGPVLVRYRDGAAGTDRTLAALGWSRRDRVRRSAAHGVVISGVALVVALGIMLLVSLRTPIGDARGIEPSPGPELDGAVYGAGALLILALTCGTLAALAWRSPARPRATRRTPLAGLAARVGLPSPAVIGIRVGLEPGPGQAPVRSTILGVAVGAAAVIGVLAYTSSAQELRAKPEWFGVTWDDFVYLEDAPDGLLGTVRAWPEVEAASPLLFWVPALGLGPDRSVSRVVGMGAGEDAVETTVIDGRAPVGDDEILLSPKLADRLGVGIGDRVDAAFEGGEFSEEPGDWGEPFTLEVVGTGPVAVGDGTFERGSAMTDEGLAANLPPDLVGGLPLEQLANFILIDRAEGVTDAQIADRLAAAGVDFDPGDVDQQVLLENLVSVDRTSTESAPDLLALVMATFATGLLAYGLSTTVARNRADLAIARALGFTPRLVSRTARWAAFAFVGAALVVAVPVGLVIGRAAWRTFATGLGVVPDPTVYPNEIAAFVAASLVAAGLIATSAARWQSRSRPATALRAE